MTAWHPENENALKTQGCPRYGTPPEIKAALEAKTKIQDCLGYDTPPEIKAHVRENTLNIYFAPDDGVAPRN